MPRKKQKIAPVPSGRICALCKKDIPVGKVCNAHHISYEKDVTLPLCYICHCIVHLRLQFHNPYDKRFGKDFGAYFVARDIARLFETYPEVIEDIKKKFPGEFK